MNKLVFPASGGFPMRPENLEFEFNAIRSAFQALVLPLTEKTSGFCNISVTYQRVGNNFVLSAGWLVINNELCLFDGGTTSALISAGARYFNISETDDSNGLDTLVNGQQFNAHKVRKAILNTVVGGLPFFEFDYFSYFNLLKVGLDSVQKTSESELTLTSDFAHPLPNKACVAFAGGVAILKGFVGVNTDLPNNQYIKLCNIEPKYAPKSRQFMTVVVLNFGSAILDVNTNGELYLGYLVPPAGGYNGSILQLDGVSWLV